MAPPPVLCPPPPTQEPCPTETPPATAAPPRPPPPPRSISWLWALSLTAPNFHGLHLPGASLGLSCPVTPLCLRLGWGRGWALGCVGVSLSSDPVAATLGTFRSGPWAHWPSWTARGPSQAPAPGLPVQIAMGKLHWPCSGGVTCGGAGTGFPALGFVGRLALSGRAPPVPSRRSCWRELAGQEEVSPVPGEAVLGPPSHPRPGLGP